MTFLWLAIWAFSGFPEFGVGDSWFIALAVMAFIDVGSFVGSIAKARQG